MNIDRRSFLTGLIAAPVIIRPGILMPIKPYIIRPVWEPEWLEAPWSPPWDAETLRRMQQYLHYLRNGPYKYQYPVAVAA